MAKTNKKPLLVLALIVLLGFYFRIAGAGFGLPDLLHPDEARIILDSMSMGQRMSLISEDINYPLFHKYVLLISYGFYFLWGMIFGFFTDKVDFAIKFLHDPSTIIYISRVVTAIMGTMTIIVAYYWGKIIDKSKTTGLLAALFVALEWQLVFESQYAIHQTLSGLTSLLAFLGLSLICERKEKKAYIIGGLTFGLAVASHQTAVLLFPGILFLFISDITQRKIDRKILLKYWITYSLIAIAIGVMGNLNWIFRFNESLNFFFQGSGGGKVTFSSAPYFIYNIPSIIYWYFSELIRRDYFIGLTILFTSVMTTVRRKRIDILYLIVLSTYFVFFYTWSLRWMHLFVGLIPISILYAAREFSGVVKRVKIKALLFLIISALIVTPNIIDILRGNSLKQTPETRQVAREWILKNIPENTTIAVDYPAYSVSLPSMYPVMLRNRVAMAYFDTQIPTEIRSRFFDSQEKIKKYHVVDMIDSKLEPVWPETMPREAIERAKKSATFRDIYAYFNFKPIDQLKNEGVSYIVIESYTYGMALTNDDPRKVFLMNYYLKDDVIPFSYNTNSVAVNTQHELMYYMVERERNYFLEILDNKIPGIRLIKEFAPKNNLGPIVKVYKVD